MKKTILLAAASAVALAGCTYMEAMGERVGLTTPPDINILIDGDQGGACVAGQLKMHADPDKKTFKIEEIQKKPFKITWKLQDGYKFVKDDIPTPTPISGPADEIYDCHTGSGTMHCWNRGLNKGQWKYKVTYVARNDNCPVQNLDPQISNE